METKKTNKRFYVVRMDIAEAERAEKKGIEMGLVERTGCMEKMEMEIEIDFNVNVTNQIKKSDEFMCMFIGVFDAQIVYVPEYL